MAENCMSNVEVKVKGLSSQNPTEMAAFFKDRVGVVATWISLSRL